MNLTGERRRRFRITIRLASDERLAVHSAAIRRGVNVSAYARMVLLGVKPERAARRPAIDTTLVVQMLDRLGAIASSLIAVAVAAQTKSCILMPSFERDLYRCLRELRGLRPQLLKALGKRGSTT
jgi:hypothetical protein